MAGAVSYGWVHDEAPPRAEWKYPPRPGWEWGASHSFGFEWWVSTGQSKYWRWLSVPLWMPFVAIALPTGILWYRDRRSTRAALRRVRGWMTPARPRKVTFGRVVIFCVLHAGADVLAMMLYIWFCNVCQPRLGLIDDVLNYGLFYGFWGTPLFGVLWAWLWTRWQNRLFRGKPGHRCLDCGYDLTGNVSGRCPECGERVVCPQPGQESP
jgi:hypothetical protein